MVNKKKIIISLSILILAGLLCIKWFWGSAWEEMKKMGCATNLKVLTTALHMYARENNNYFPPFDGVKGLKMLRKYLPDSKNNNCVFVCPGKQKPCDIGEELSAACIGYDYFGGYSVDSPIGIGIIMDKIGNHKNFGNIGFIDGHVEPFKGQKWRKYATRGTNKAP